MQPLYIPVEIIHLTFGKRLEKSDRNQSWSDLDSLDTVNIIRKSIEQNLPFIESLINPYSFCDYYINSNHPEENIRIYEAIVYTSIWIDLPNCKKEVQNFINYINENTDISIAWIQQIKDDMSNPLLSSTPKNILINNKENLIKILKL